MLRFPDDEAAVNERESRRRDPGHCGAVDFAGGCVGVMAAEIRHNRSQADVMPLARFIAAQFATIIGPSDEGLSKVAEA
jgi:hypothetical protein